jgi:hypothetical protein
MLKSGIEKEEISLPKAGKNEGPIYSDEMKVNMCLLLGELFTADGKYLFFIFYF